MFWRVKDVQSTFLLPKGDLKHLCMVTRRTSNNCAFGIYEGHIGLFCLALISEGF